MSIHIGAKAGEIAPTVLITGDPLRAKHHAEKMLSEPVCYNKIRGMLGYTGEYKGKRISIQGTGIGIPSTALYIHELIHFFGAKCIIRIGTCGAIQQYINLGQVILARSAATDSNAVNMLFKDKTFRPAADPDLLQQAEEIAKKAGINTLTGDIFSTDFFYADDDPVRWNSSVKEGLLAVDMETSILYTLAIKNKIQSLSILTVSDNILTGETASSHERERETNDMVKLALEIVT